MNTKKSNFMNDERDEKQAIRCLKIVDYIYLNGSSSLSQLCGYIGKLTVASGLDSEIVERDIEQLMRCGLPIILDDDGIYHIQAQIPGFEMRLTSIEWSLIKSWAVTYLQSEIFAKCTVSKDVMMQAITVLDAGLHKFYPDTKGISKMELTPKELETLTSARSVGVLRSSDVTGITRLTLRRLHLVDFIQTRAAIDINQLMTILDTSERTVHYDLHVLRCASIEIKFFRHSQEYVIDDLNRYLCLNTTSSHMEVLKSLLQPLSNAYKNNSEPTILQCASYKLLSYIQLHFNRVNSIPIKAAVES